MINNLMIALAADASLCSILPLAAWVAVVQASGLQLMAFMRVFHLVFLLRDNNYCIPSGILSVPKFDLKMCVYIP